MGGKKKKSSQAEVVSITMEGKRKQYAKKTHQSMTPK